MPRLSQGLVAGLTATLTAVLTAAGLAVGAPLPAAGADDETPPRVSSALADARGATSGRGEDVTMALTRLRLAYAGLAPGEQAAADGLLARPTDGPADPQEFGYTVAEAVPVCGASFCVHYVPTTEDAPAPVDVDADGMPEWVETTLAELEAVMAFHTTTLGYRPPPGDGALGGNVQFDVYLSQLGDGGLYGFCAPENKVPGQRFVYSGYCVLDNDFGEFSQGPLPSLRVTAAHEFFHAVQFGYDATEDGWLLEATATWVEERYADTIDDNRQYLRYGQLGRPRRPLDEFDSSGSSQYGNWLFFELVSQEFGVDAIRRIWEQAEATRGAPDRYSTEAVKQVVQSRGGPRFADFYARFATANQLPAGFYSEGTAYRPSPVVRTARLTPSRRTLTDTRRLDHLTSTAYRLVPSRALRGTWRLRGDVHGPSVAACSAATLLVHERAGGVTVRDIVLSDNGAGRRTIAFSRDRIRSVTIVVANGSTRFSPCWEGTSYSCQGIPRDDRDVYDVTAAVSR
ncbi:MAG: MXAN_6640 family putative metalloprotease [Nocardioides sp.]